MQLRHRPGRTPALLLLTTALLVGSTACASEDESSSGITETGITQHFDPSTDTTAMTPSGSLDDGTTTTTAETPLPTVEVQPAAIRNVEILILEIFPPQVSVEISGDHPTPCHEIFTEVTAEGSDYAIEVWSLAPDSDFGCAAVLEPFVEVVPLKEGEGFEPGEYTVTVNGETHAFTV